MFVQKAFHRGLVGKDVFAVGTVFLHRQAILGQDCLELRIDVLAHLAHLLVRRTLSLSEPLSVFEIVRHHLTDVDAGPYILLDVGRFSAVPDPSDLQRVTLDERSLDLRGCQPGNCPVRLSAADVARFQREVNWSGPDWREQSMTVWRSVLTNYASAYLANGRSALPDYVNRRDPLSVASEVADLASNYGFVSGYSPEFAAYLKEFGSRIPPGAEQMLYWTREDFGIRPIVRISHQVIFSTTPPATPVTLIAINQVYADHYLDASLTVTLGLDSGRGFYMISARRARTRSLSGLLRRFARLAVQGRSRDAMRSALAATKAAIEK